MSKGKSKQETEVEKEVEKDLVTMIKAETEADEVQQDADIISEEPIITPTPKIKIAQDNCPKEIWELLLWYIRLDHEMSVMHDCMRRYAHNMTDYISDRSNHSDVDIVIDLNHWLNLMIAHMSTARSSMLRDMSVAKILVNIPDDIDLNERLYEIQVYSDTDVHGSFVSAYRWFMTIYAECKVNDLAIRLYKKQISEKISWMQANPTKVDNVHNALRLQCIIHNRLGSMQQILVMIRVHLDEVLRMIQNEES